MRKVFVMAALVCAACGGSSGDNTPPVTPTVATPTFSVPAGIKNDAIAVTITTSTTGAAIHYTTDGSTPTEVSPTYTTALAISTATTVKAIATKSGSNPSAVATAAYTFQVGTPTFSVAGGTYASAQNVALSTVTTGATIYYTTNGATPTTSSSVYAAPISLATDPSTTTIKALAVRTGFTDSAVASATYTIDSSTTPTATPTFSPLPGTFTSVQNVTISTTTAGATIYYTTDGSTPTVASTVYAAPVAVGGPVTTLKAFATAPGHTASGVATGVYTINLPPAETPTFSPVAGPVTAGQVVTISSTTSGAVIHCTTNGTAATAGSPVCTTVTITAATTIRAVAAATGYTTSAEAIAAYTITGGGGTDFLTVCGQIQTAIASLMSSCMKMNPALFTSPGPYMGAPCAELQKEIIAGRVTYDASQGAACAAALPSLTCSSVFPDGNWNTPASCNAALVGQVATSGTCYVSDDCANGWCTADLTATCPGTCQAYAGLGASCGNGTTECAPGLMCWSNGDPATCRTPAGLGAACPCQAGLWCDQQIPSPVCKAPKTSGTCSYQDGECAVGYQCFFDGTSQHCAAIAGNGGSCTANPCGWGYACASGTCHPWATVGQSCVGASTGGACTGGYCDGTNTCVAYKANGATCTSYNQCASGDCDGTGHCVADYCAAP